VPVRLEPLRRLPLARDGLDALEAPDPEARLDRLPAAGVLGALGALG
jgi:hypothetical protein